MPHCLGQHFSVNKDKLHVPLNGRFDNTAHASVDRLSKMGIKPQPCEFRAHKNAHVHVIFVRVNETAESHDPALCIFYSCAILSRALELQYCLDVYAQNTPVGA